MIIKKKESARLIGYILAIALLVHPAYFEQISVINKIYSLSFPLVSICIWTAFMFYAKNNKIGYVPILICAFFAFSIAVAWMRGTRITLNYLHDPVNCLNLTFLVVLGIKKDFKTMLQAMSFVLGMYVFANFLTVVFYPGGFYDDGGVYGQLHWFLGYKNVMVRTMLPALAINSIYSVYKKQRLTIVPVALFGMCIISEYMVDSKTGLLGIVLFGVILFWFRKDALPHYFNLKNIGVFILIVCAGLVLFDIATFFSSVLSEMGEFRDIEVRMLIWQRTLELISKKPVLGYGYKTSSQMQSLLNVTTGWAYFSHPHNYYLYIFLQGGAVGFTLVMIIFYQIGKKCLWFRDNFIAKAMLALYISFMIMGLTESLVGATLFYPLMVIVDSCDRYDVKYAINSKRGE